MFSITRYSIVISQLGIFEGAIVILPDSISVIFAYKVGI